MKGRRVLVVGLGRFGGGLGVTRWLAGQGADLVVTDLARADSLLESLQALADLDIEFHLGSHDEVVLEGIDLAIINPAVDKRKAKFFQQIQQRSIPWTTEMNLFCQRCPAFVIGVTGSFGKSTTTAMIGSVLDRAIGQNGVSFRRVVIGGNIGGSLFGELPALTSSDVVVLELSSAQLEDTPLVDWTPDVAVLTNLHPHHLDRYDSYQAYQVTKLNLLAGPTSNQPLFAGALEEGSKELVLGKLGADRVRWRPVAPLDPMVRLRVPGQHNRNNAALASAVCRDLGVDQAMVNQSLEEFTGLPHRWEFIRDLGGVSFIDDSKSTSPETTIEAIAAISTPMVLLIGGQAKEVSLAKLAQRAVDRCRIVVCFGEAGASLAKACGSSGLGDKASSVREVSTLEEAVTLAAQLAHEGDTVLFSPGTPSFDRYTNYVQRGEHFVRLVQELQSAAMNS